MADNPLNTPFDNAITPQPSGAFGTKAADPGGPGPGGDPLSTPYDNGLCSTPSGQESANTSGLNPYFEYIPIGEEPPTNAPDISTGQIPVAGLGKK